MKEPYVEGVAPHHDLESCANLLRGSREALTEADAGWVLSHEIFAIGIADPPQADSPNGKATRSRTLCASPGPDPRGRRPHARVETSHA